MSGFMIVKAKPQYSLPPDLEARSNLLAHRGRAGSYTINTPAFFAKYFLNSAQNSNHTLVETLKTEISQNIFLDGLIFLDQQPISDATTLISMVKHEKTAFFRRLSGMFSIVIQDGETFYAAKDSVGFNPLYYLDTPEYVIFASELKVLNEFPGIPKYLEPGQVVIFDGTTLKIEWFLPVTELCRPSEELNCPSIAVSELTSTLYRLLDEKVKLTMQGPGKVSALLSGGIDSTVICALALNHLETQPGEKLDVYTVAVEGSNDLKHAKLFAAQHADKLNHHIHMLSFEEMKRIIPKVIYHLETFDAALIRSAIPMFYVCSQMTADTEVLLTGEGGDELFGGYSYLKDLDAESLRQEFIDFLKIEHATGLQRVDRIPYAFGIEARAPWFDLDLVKFSFTVPLELKLKADKGTVIEKWIIRDAFKGILPPEIAWRKKAKFSEGVGSEFLMRNFLNQTISDAEFAKEKEIFPGQFVKSKEELYYWRIFQELFKPKEKFIKNLPRTSVFTL
jgi:asparagine synthase (glutamine-hydrolysing)